MKTIRTIIVFLFVVISGCTKENTQTPSDNTTKYLTLFFVNDVHAQIDNFAKVKYIIDTERKTTDVIVASSGDLFSGNPIVDNYDPKGFPIIDLMNYIGFDIAVIGNHEFDYGINELANRINQSDFQWVCANVNTSKSTLPQLPPYKTITKNNLNITFLGLVETGGSHSKIIPATHPQKVETLTFERAQNIVNKYANTKTDENADLFIALSHLGYNGFDKNMGDFQLAQQFPFFDLIIGGHSHAIIDTVVNSIPIFQANCYLNYLGKIKLTIKNRAIKSIKFDLINLNNFTQFDKELQAIIDNYNDCPELDEVIGYSQHYHSRSQLGCFYTDALRLQTKTDVAFQNTGGIRSGLDKGNITKREIYEISPFNNGVVIYKMTVAEIKEFLIGSKSGFYYSGIKLAKVGNKIELRDLNNNIIPNDYILTVGINDYIPAVNDLYFPNNGVLQPLTAAETLIAYLQNIEHTVDYTNCSRYFRY